MKIEIGKGYAALALHLLGDARLREASNIRWGPFLQLAKSNRVLVRVSDGLEKLHFEPPAFFARAVEQERQRVRINVEHICQIGKVCAEHGIEFIFAKAFQYYPDMGCDLDLFILSRSTKPDALIVKTLQASRKKRSLCNRIAGTVNYRLEGSQSLLEIHHARIGRLGEEGSYLKLVIQNGRHIHINGAQLLAPSSEDQLILQVAQKVFGRLYIRLSEIVHAISLLRQSAMDWDYVIGTTRRLGIFHGLCCYLSYIEQIHQELFGSSLLHSELRKVLILNGWGQIEFRAGFYRLPGAQVAAKLYLSKFKHALFSGNVEAAGRLCLLPLVTTAIAFQKLKRIASS